MFVRLPGETRDERRPQRQSGNPRAQPHDEVLDVLARGFPSHEVEHRRVDVLERHVYVLGDALVARDGGDQFVAPVCGMGVEQPHPEVALDGAEFVQQVTQGDAPG